MGDQINDAYKLWKQSDVRARRMDIEVAAQWERFDAQRGAAPSAEMLRRLSLMRAVAGNRLRAVMGLMGFPGPARHVVMNPFRESDFAESDEAA